jgi:hemin uptake protein HemP
MNQDTQTRSSEANTSRQANPVARRVDARDLFRGSPIVLIEFQGERYQLRQTRAGKLILTK